MDPIQSWLDAKAVRRMAESLMAPAPEVDQSALDAGYGEDFEGFAEANVASQSTEQQLNLPIIEDEDATPVAVKPRFSQVPAEALQAAVPAVAQAQPESLVRMAEEPMPEGATADGVGTSARIVVSHALADAKRMAERSGILSPGTEPPESSVAEAESLSSAALHPGTMPPEAAETVGNPPAPVETSPLTPLVSSPFQLCEDQSPEENVLVARQIDPSELAEADEVTSPVDSEEAPAPELDSEASATQVESREKRVVLSPRPVRPSSGAARGPFLTRLKDFSGQLRDRLGAKAMFLIDNEGQILIDEVGNTKLIQVARTLANASNTASRQTEGSADVGNLHVKIGASATLEVIPCRSRYGLLILGVVCPAPLGAERVKLVAEHLAKTVEPGGGV